MRRFVLLTLVSLVAVVSVPRADDPPGKIGNPGQKIYAASVGPAGKLYVGTDGGVQVLDAGKPSPFGEGLKKTTALASFAEVLYAVDGTKIHRIDKAGKMKGTIEFPTPPTELGNLIAGEAAVLYVTDTRPNGATIYRVDPKGKAVAVADSERTPGLKNPRGLAFDGSSFLLVLEGSTGDLLRVRVGDGSAVRLAGGFGTGGGLVWDWYGRLYVGDSASGVVSVIPKAGDKPVKVADGHKGLTGLALGVGGKSVLVVNPTAGSLAEIPVGVPGQKIDETPLAVTTEVAFPNLKWTDWKSEDSKGLPIPLRPIVLTHAGDGSNRVFVATEHGVIHSFPNDQKADKTTVFLDIQDRVIYNDKQNEEGLLGLAFHPKFKSNGEFFVYYTVKEPKLTNVLSRFKVSKDDPNKADPGSEQEIMRFTKPFWNHNGGTVVFGPDGFLYVAVGDGGSGGDPMNNGQNLSTLFGKVLRIDVDRKEGGLAYAIPKDNPFVGRPNARGEIWAYGLRNPWRIAFDNKTGKLWCGEVGQNLFEEINILTSGGNYGWSVREAFHPFGANGSLPRPDLIEPIWEYHHDVGKSITGGNVYRGKLVPQLDGGYLYADYVSSRIWALWYDEGKGRVMANRPIKDPSVAILSFGEDEKGETYFLGVSATGKGIYRFTPAK